MTINTRIAGKTVFFIAWKQNKKQNNKKEKHTTNKANMRTEGRNIHHENQNKKDRRKK